ncbi:protein of unknown function [Burkholderia multivorans]
MTERSEHPRTLDRRLDMPGEIADRTGTGRQRRQRPHAVVIEHVAIDTRMPHDAMQITVGKLQELMQPVDEFHVWIAPQLAELCRRFDAAVEQNPELPEQRLARNRHAYLLVLRSVCTRLPT